MNTETGRIGRPADYKGGAQLACGGRIVDGYMAISLRRQDASVVTKLLGPKPFDLETPVS